MQYLVTRQGQTYGPYSLDELERYVGTGNVLLTDLAKAEGTVDSMAVSAILAAAGRSPVPPTSYGQAAYAPSPGSMPMMYGAAAASQYPDPPNMNWLLVMLLNIVTFGIFLMIWNCITAAWLRRVRPDSKVLIYYGVAYFMYIISMGYRLNSFLTSFRGHTATGNFNVVLTAPYIFASLLGLGYWVLKLIARFTEKSEMEQHFTQVEPLGLNMSGVMVFFFGGLYIQSEMSRINGIKEALRFQANLR